LLRRYSRPAVARAVEATDPRHLPPAEKTLAGLRADPTLAMRAAGLDPDPWQRDLILCPDRQITALCTRRSGKTRTVAAKVTARCLTRPSKVLVFAPTEDQSKELLQYVREMNDALGSPVPVTSETETRIKWANGSEVKAKTDRPKSSRGFTPDLVVIDEAAQVTDLLYLSVQPMQILGRCDFMALSTPFGKIGWFFDLWDDAAKFAHWTPFRVTAYQCPRIDPAVLDEHRATMPPRWFDQEYLAVFNDAVDAVFDRHSVDACEVAGDQFSPLDLTA
jgi:hypothetical protein